MAEVILYHLVFTEEYKDFRKLWDHTAESPGFIAQTEQIKGDLVKHGWGYKKGMEESIDNKEKEKMDEGSIEQSSTTTLNKQMPLSFSPTDVPTTPPSKYPEEKDLIEGTAHISKTWQTSFFPGNKTLLLLTCPFPPLLNRKTKGHSMNIKR